MNRQERKIIEQQEIIPESLDLGINDNKRVVCPFCKAKHESSFNIRRLEQGIYYNCYRAACAVKGFISSLPGTTQLECVKKKSFTPKEFTYPLEPLPEWVVTTINKKYEITEEELNEQGYKYSPDTSRIWCPLFGRRGQVYGSQTKVFGAGATGPKTVIYRSAETSGLHYVRQGERRGGAIAITEDILSGIKVSRFVRAVALLGTSLLPNQLAELREETDHLILMLDPDMYSKMINYKRKYSFYFRNFSVILLSKDPKDLPQQELEEKIYDY